MTNLQTLAMIQQLIKAEQERDAYQQLSQEYSAVIMELKAENEVLKAQLRGLEVVMERISYGR